MCGAADVEQSERWSNEPENLIRKAVSHHNKDSDRHERNVCFTTDQKSGVDFLDLFYSETQNAGIEPEPSTERFWSCRNAVVPLPQWVGSSWWCCWVQRDPRGLDECLCSGGAGSRILIMSTTVLTSTARGTGPRPGSQDCKRREASPSQQFVVVLPRRLAALRCVGSPQMTYFTTRTSSLRTCWFLIIRFLTHFVWSSPQKVALSFTHRLMDFRLLRTCLTCEQRIIWIT